MSAQLVMQFLSPVCDYNNLNIFLNVGLYYCFIKINVLKFMALQSSKKSKHLKYFFLYFPLLRRETKITLF